MHGLAKILIFRNFQSRLRNAKKLERLRALKTRSFKPAILSGDALVRRINEMRQRKWPVFCGQEFEIAKRQWSKPRQSGCDKAIIPGRYCGYG
jgi:hypothetical protein